MANISKAPSKINIIKERTIKLSGSFAIDKFPKIPIEKIK
ncbi:hypothetical protein MNV_1840013 [Candidatus Methanoperedens nitroreducens]|uniref:Uncharacterized protein n=1 Tax=Candidatus Methanoperedens nitratireducens TaxID=1392998 RepID=A0A284VML7_9EURY|nr:hypothetical protein MNV_1840013 [Candidatus Methanoperedens nitroreducens]